MLKAGKKTVVTALLLMMLSSQVLGGETKLYQYDGKLPFVQMMLNMMTAMGILDRLPSNGRYGFMGGSSSGMNGAGWGSPDWGVLPVESYTRSPYGYNAYGARQNNASWSRGELDGWVNEPWENSAWNAQAKKSTMAKPDQVSQAAPLVQNFNYNTAAPKTENQNSAMPSNTATRPSPLEKIAPQYRQPPLNAPPSNQINNQAYQAAINKPRQKPCITDFCGLKKPNLNGLWVAQDGEMLGIKNNQYLWSDSNSRYLTGQIKIQNEYLVANVDGYNRLMRFKYKLAGNRLLTMQPDGKVREFVRMRGEQYSQYAQGGLGNYRQGYSR